jgi:hypothetical protein
MAASFFHVDDGATRRAGDPAVKFIERMLPDGFKATRPNWRILES